MNNSFLTLLSLPFIFLIIVLCLFVPVLYVYSDNIDFSLLDISSSTNFIFSNNSEFLWPTPRLYYYNISIWL